MNTQELEYGALVCAQVSWYVGLYSPSLLVHGSMYNNIAEPVVDVIEFSVRVNVEMELSRL